MSDTPDTPPVPDEMAPTMEFVEPMEPIEALKLGDQFDGALLGATVGGRYAYSMVILTEIAMSKFKMDVDTAKRFVAHQIFIVQRDNGPSAPVFIDDELVRGEPRFIVAPDGKDVPKGILVPGQNHGAVKGFIAPKELGQN